MNPTRRRFLFALGAGGAGAAAVASQVIPPAATEVAEAPDASLSPGYRETDHVRGYYRTAKI
jgi:hypothetical protein